jgi:hypothetical protein
LISLPDRSPGGGTTLRHILVDVGNVQSGEGGNDTYFEPVLRSIKETLNSGPLDLYVMTHEHLDHVQGLWYGDNKLDPPVRLQVAYAWLTASAEGNAYYQRFPEARRRRLALTENYRQIQRLLTALGATGQAIPMAVKSLMANNDPKGTERCVAYLRGIAETTTYVYQGCELRGRHPFHEAQLKILAPQEDVSDYYGRFHPLTLGVTDPSEPGRTPVLKESKAPKGVDEESFRIFLEKRRGGYIDNLLAIDRAANNTSVVFSLTWRGWTLLFAGDAEIRSWQTMEREGMLAPVHFLKVSHHGSKNGTPEGEPLSHMLPREQPDGRDRVALISTFKGAYNNVPDDRITQMLKDRGLTVVEVDKQVRPGGYVEIEFPESGDRIRQTAVQAGKTG